MRYVLLCREDTPEPEDIHKIENEPGVKILDHSVPRALLVEVSEDTAAKLRSSLKNWVVAEEKNYPHPVQFKNTRHRK